MRSNRLSRIERSIEKIQRASKDAHARHIREMRQLDAMRRRFIAFTVKDDRKQRKSMAELKAAQLVTQKMLHQFLSSQRGRNGRA